MEDDNTAEMRAQGTYAGAQLHLFTGVWVLRPQGELQVGGQYLGIYHLLHMPLVTPGSRAGAV